MFKIAIKHLFFRILIAYPSLEKVNGTAVIRFIPTSGALSLRPIIKPRLVEDKVGNIILVQ